MKYNWLQEDGIGTFVGINMSDDSVLLLNEWMSQNAIKNRVAADELHITLVLDKHNSFSHKAIKYAPPVIIKHNTYTIDVFGADSDVLVLKFTSPFLTKRHAQLIKRHHITWGFPTYSPHITLTNHVQEIMSELEPPEFDIELVGEYVQPFDMDWGK